MRMSRFQVEHLCQSLVQNLKTKGLIAIQKPDAAVLQRMQEIFLADLKVEDAINQEAQNILDQYEKKMGPNIDRQKMFQMIKKQLIKDRNVVV